MSFSAMQPVAGRLERPKFQGDSGPDVGREGGGREGGREGEREGGREGTPCELERSDG